MKEELIVSDEQIEHLVANLRGDYERSKRMSRFSVGPATASFNKYSGVAAVSVGKVRSDMLASVKKNPKVKTSEGLVEVIRVYVEVPNALDPLILEVPENLRIGPDPPHKDSFFRKLFKIPQANGAREPNLKELLSKATGIDVKDMRLVFNNIPLSEDASRLSHYNVCHGSSIHLLTQQRKSANVLLATAAGAELRSGRVIRLNRAVLLTRVVGALKIDPADFPTVQPT